MKKFFLLFLFLSTVLISHSAQNQPSSEREILFIANINGVIENCSCPAKPFGGMGRLAAIISRKREENPDLLFIDGGDFLNSYSYQALNEAVMDIYRLMKPDIITLGDQEFVEGLGYFERNFKDFLPWIRASNIQAGKQKFLPKAAFREKNKLPVVILAYLDKKAFSFIPLEKEISFHEEIFEQEYRQVKSSDFLIVVYHGLFWRLKNFVKKYPDIDCVLLGHNQTDNFMIDEKPWIIGGGVDGEYLIDIKIKDIDNVAKIEVSKIEVKKSVLQEKTAEKIIDKFKSKSELTEK